jgi:hypothetical protein
MGWLFDTHPTSKANYVKELLARNFTSSSPCALLDHSLRGNCLWVLARAGGQKPFILLFLLECRDGCWGYKDMDESMGPYYLSCPLKFLEQAPEPQGCNRNHAGSGKSWRDFVREYHAGLRQRRKSRPVVGQKIRLDGERFPGYEATYTVTADLGRKGLLLNNYLRLNARQIKWVELVGSPVPSAPSS